MSDQGEENTTTGAEEVEVGLKELKLDGDGDDGAAPPPGEAEEAAAAPAPTETVDLGDRPDRPDMAGYYEHIRNENFENFLAANGANFLIRKMAANTSPDLEIRQKDDHFVVKTISTLMTKEVEFTVGQEYVDKQPNGVQFKVMPQWEGNKLVCNMAPVDADKGHRQKVTRHLEGTELILTLEVGEVLAKRVFKLVARPKNADEAVPASNIDLNNPFKGKYKHVKDENFEAVLGALGAPYLMRKVASRTHPDVEIEQDGDRFVFSIVSTFYTQKAEFTVGGEQFSTKTPMGAVTDCKATWEDDKLKIVGKQRKEGAKEEVSYRELLNDQLHISFHIDGVVGKRIFERSND